MEVERKQKEECTYKPIINDYPIPPSKELSKEERMKKLTQPKTVVIQERDRKKNQIEIEEQ